jgi:hypothetical protein
MGYRIGRFALSGKVGSARAKGLRTGCSIPESGIYRILHLEHRLPAEVTLLRNQPFPRCSKCSEPVYFELVRSAPTVGSDGNGFMVALYGLPELADQQDESLAG